MLDPHTKMNILQIEKFFDPSHSMRQNTISPQLEAITLELTKDMHMPHYKPA